MSRRIAVTLLTLLALTASGVAAAAEHSNPITGADLECDHDVLPPALVAQSGVDDQFQYVESPKTLLDSFEQALVEEYPCDFTEIFVDMERGGLYVYGVNLPLDQVGQLYSQLRASHELFLEYEEELGFLGVRDAVASRAEAQNTRRAVTSTVSEIANQRGATQVTQYMDQMGVLVYTVYGVNNEDETFAEITRAILDEGVSEERFLIEAGVLGTQLASQFDFNPERGNQLRHVNGGPLYGNIECTGGPYVVRNGNVEGTTAGHCGPPGYGIFGESSSPLAYFGPILKSCGFTGGTCGNDVLFYDRKNGSSASTSYITAMGINRNVAAVGSTAGPPLGGQVCFGGYGQVLTHGSERRICKNVSIRRLSFVLGPPLGGGGNITILEGFQIDTTASIAGDSGGVIWQKLAGNRIIVYGTATGKLPWATLASNSGWLGHFDNAPVLVCGC